MSKTSKSLDPERQRLENQRQGVEDWRSWGPYLAERAWGTVREDYSPDGTAWEFFPHDHARSRAYRWNEDGLGGICDERQNLCFALALWNGRDPILKERAFGLTGNQGNHGEDVKEYYFYTDATPSHSYLSYLYKYPQAEYPYALLVEENARRGRDQPPFSLLDSGVFAENRYWDVQVEYAKANPKEIHVRITAYNRGPEEAVLHLLPTLWFRNTWSWGVADAQKPSLAERAPPSGAAWSIGARHEELGDYRLYGKQAAQLLFTENDTDTALLWGLQDPSGYAKDAFHRRVVEGETGVVNPERCGTKGAAWYVLTVPAGGEARVDLVLVSGEMARPFAQAEQVFADRRGEADEFYAGLLPTGDADDRRILRQALAGMIWSKQFFHYDVLRWLAGDGHPPPDGRQLGRNGQWTHLRAADVISMPDKWEYPWFAAWDLAFQCIPLALVDPEFAKEQLWLMLFEQFQHPNGQIPA
ncbi:MAG: hypothetical protein H6R26_1141, partial [Proteobacteria bacterium]|nr:hypothetical protein [Pseudomonadota bacterium]